MLINEIDKNWIKKKNKKFKKCTSGAQLDALLMWLVVCTCVSPAEERASGTVPALSEVEEAADCSESLGSSPNPRWNSVGSETDCWNRFVGFGCWFEDDRWSAAPHQNRWGRSSCQIYLS